MSKAVFNLKNDICEEMYWARAEHYYHQIPKIDNAIDQILEEIISMYPPEKRNFKLRDRICGPFMERRYVSQKDFYLKGIADGMNLAKTLAKAGNE